ncbi:hypothetical protein V1L52_03460 [Treponema sp. HNW]|uniref:hypothetical protein n=1 Tax=Treponema sp. HNW TaxID=3116654 RepID=UPI003D13A1C9
MLKRDFPYETVNTFLRTCTKPFTSKTIQRLLRAEGERAALREVSDFLDSHPSVFPLSDGSYIARPGLFTDAYFSIKPRRFEVDSGILIIGHRCMPFVDPEMLPHELNFTFAGMPVHKKCIEIASDDVLDMYRLFGEEYVPQFLGLDPGNEDRDFAENDFEIPNRIFLTVCDMRALYKRFDFSYADRLSARLVNWDEGLIELRPIKEMRSNLFESTEENELRERWYDVLETCLLSTIEEYGPCHSIEEQLVCAFFGNTDILCISGCGSLDEYLMRTKNVVFAEYGVETRLWKKGEECTASSWRDRFESGIDVSETLYGEIGIPLPEFMLDAYILDSLYRRDKGVREIFKRIIPSSFVLEEWQLKTFLLHLETKYVILSEKYNRFTDFNKGEVRSSALKLYSALVKLICELDSCGLPADFFPQQDLVILSQLFAHTGHLVEALLYQENLSDKDLSAASASLEGMTFSFEDIEEILVSVMENKKKDAFSIVK